MNSIDQQQPENNRKDLTQEEGIKKIRELAEKASICFFCSEIRTGQPFITRPMTIQEVDEDGQLWFLSAKDSHLNASIKTDEHVQLLFQGSDYSDFLEVYGNASIINDRDKIEKYWKPMLKVWFTEGKDDPRISVLKVDPIDSYYWDTKHNQVIGLIKRTAGAILGKTLDDSIQGKIKV